MKTMMLAAVAAMTLGAGTLGAGVALAQGTPPGYQPPAYGSAWAAEKIAAEKAHDAALARFNQSQAPRTANSGTSAKTNGG